jgi:hypothetical protein
MEQTSISCSRISTLRAPGSIDSRRARARVFVCVCVWEEEGGGGGHAQPDVRCERKPVVVFIPRARRAGASHFILST